MVEQEAFTAADLAACAEREVKQRQRVYPNLVISGKMTPELARRQIDMMTQIAAEYRAKAIAEAAKADLFGGA